MKKIKFTHPALEDHPEMNGADHLMVDYSNTICHDCQGEGTHFRADLDEEILTQSFEDDADDEGLQRYLEGAYDELCNTCMGSGIVKSPILPDWADKAIFEYRMEEVEGLKYAAQERAAGA